MDRFRSMGDGQSPLDTDNEFSWWAYLATRGRYRCGNMGGGKRKIDKVTLADTILAITFIIFYSGESRHELSTIRCCWTCHASTDTNYNNDLYGKWSFKAEIHVHNEEGKSPQGLTEQANPHTMTQSSIIFDN